MTTTPAATAPTIESIMLKVRKLQRLAAAAGTPEEAAAATAKVAELMERHAIEQVAIDGLGDPDARRGLGSEKVATTSAAWRRRLLATVARDTRCRTVYHTGRGAMTIVGRSDDLAVVQAMYSWLCGQIESYLRVAWASEGQAVCEASSWTSSFSGTKHYDSGYTPAAWKKSYREGAVDTLRNRIQAARLERERKRTTADSTALMVLDDTVVALYRELFPRLAKGRAYGYGNGAGYGAGQRDGRSMSLSNGGHLGAGALRLGSR